MQHWQSSAKTWLDTCANAAQAMRKSGSVILQALSEQRLPVFERQCPLAGKQWQLFPTLDERLYTIALYACSQCFIAEASLLTFSLVFQSRRCALQDEGAKES